MQMNANSLLWKTTNYLKKTYPLKSHYDLYQRPKISSDKNKHNHNLSEMLNIHNKAIH